MSRQPVYRPPAGRQQHVGKTQQTTYPNRLLRKVLARLSRPDHPTVPTAEQQQMVLTSLILGFISIFSAFFPICGLLISLAGLLMGLYGRHSTALRTMSSWAIALSLLGLLLTLINIIVTVSIYFSTYFL